MSQRPFADIALAHTTFPRASRRPAVGAHCRRALLASVLACAAATAAAQDRGQLLYETHCITCHTTQVHWREQRLARDWEGLRRQVQRWQAVSSLGWTDAEVAAVARHLNRSFYQFNVPVARAAPDAPTQ